MRFLRRWFVFILVVTAADGCKTQGVDSQLRDAEQSDPSSDAGVAPSVFDTMGVRAMPSGGAVAVGDWYAPPLPPESVDFEGHKVTLQMGAIQAALLPSGKVIMINGSSNRFNSNQTLYQHVDNTALFDPGIVDDPNAGGTHVPVEHGYQKVASLPEDQAFKDDLDAQQGPNIDLFCGGQIHLPNGDLLVIGGTRTKSDYALHRQWHGIKHAQIFNWHTEKFVAAATPSEGRWYPTLTSLPSGNVVVFAGYNQDGKVSQVAELYDWAANTWSRQDFTAIDSQPFKAFGGAFDNYPRIFLQHDGRLLITGDGVGPGNRAVTQHHTLFATVKESPFGLQFALGPDRPDTTRVYPTQVFDPRSNNGDVLIMGGGVLNFSVGDTGKQTTDNTNPKRQSVSSLATFRAATDGSPAHFDPTVDQFLGNDHDPVTGAVHSTGRDNLNVVVLPTKQLLVLGGGNHSYVDPLFHPLLFTPAGPGAAGPDVVGGFTRQPMAPYRYPRLYHNTSLLLRDGRVLLMGGNSFLSTLGVSPAVPTGTPSGFKDNGAPVIIQANEYNAPPGGVDISKDQPAETYQVEIFTPPYLYIAGPRPKITAVNGTAATGTGVINVPYGATIPLVINEATQGGSVTLVRLGSVTHGMNNTQKLHDLAVTYSDGADGTGGAINVQTPADPTVAPPGVYMLFYLNAAGKPSIAEMVQLAAQAST